jgi:hypothetical protein
LDPERKTHPFSLDAEGDALGDVNAYAASHGSLRNEKFIKDMFLRVKAATALIAELA